MRRHASSALATAILLAVLLALYHPPRPAWAQSTGPSGGLLIEGISNAQSVATLDATMLQSVGNTGATSPGKAHQVGGVDSGGALRALAVDASGHSATVRAAATRTDLGTSIASGSTLLVAGSGQLVSADVAVGVTTVAGVCFFDGNPTGTGVVIAGGSLVSSVVNVLFPAGHAPVKFANGLYVRAALAFPSCTSLGSSATILWGHVQTTTAP